MDRWMNEWSDAFIYKKYIYTYNIKINESLRVVHFLAREGKTYKIKQ